MISSPKRRPRAAPATLADAAARFARDLAVQPPTKGVASIKAASDVYEANLGSGARPADGREPTTPGPDK